MSTYRPITVQKTMARNYWSELHFWRICNQCDQQCKCSSRYEATIENDRPR